MRLKPGVLFWGVVFLLGGAILAFLGHGQMVVALAGLLVCTLPGFLLNLRADFLTSKCFAWIVLGTSVSGLVYFFWFPEKYHFQQHRPFFFTAAECFPVFMQMGLFLVVLGAVFAALGKVFSGDLAGYLQREESTPAKLGGQASQTSGKKAASPKGSSFFLSGLLVAVVLIHIPLHQWMYDRQIGMTGIEPPLLPFKISGILTNWAKIVIPAVISYLYVASRNRSPFLILGLAAYACLLGAGTFSRGAAFLVLLGVLFAAVQEKKWGELALGVTGLLVALSFANMARELGMTSIGDVSAGDTAEGLFSFLVEILLSPGLFLGLGSLPFEFLGRFESWQSLWLSHHFDPAAVGGSWEIFWKFVAWELVDLGHRAVHLEYIGYVPAEGFYNCGSSVLNYTFMAANSGWPMVILFAIYSAVYLSFFEVSVKVVAIRWRKTTSLAVSGVLMAFTLLYYTAPGFSTLNQLFGVAAVGALLVRVTTRSRATVPMAKSGLKNGKTAVPRQPELLKNR